jgi:hypothetical protein
MSYCRHLGVNDYVHGALRVAQQSLKPEEPHRQNGFNCDLYWPARGKGNASVIVLLYGTARLCLTCWRKLRDTRRRKARKSPRVIVGEFVDTSLEVPANGCETEEFIYSSSNCIVPAPLVSCSLVKETW